VQYRPYCELKEPILKDERGHIEKKKTAKRDIINKKRYFCTRLKEGMNNDTSFVSTKMPHEE